MISRCPTRAAAPWMRGALYRWRLWRRFGELPAEGRLLDQDARTVEAFGVLDQEMGIIELRERELASKAAKRAADRDG